MKEINKNLLWAVNRLHERLYGSTNTVHYHNQSEIQLLLNGRLMYKKILWSKAQDEVTEKVKIYNIVFLRRYDVYI